MAGPNHPGNGQVVVAGATEFFGQQNPGNGYDGGGDDNQRGFHIPPIRPLRRHLATQRRKEFFPYWRLYSNSEESGNSNKILAAKERKERRDKSLRSFFCDLCDLLRQFIFGCGPAAL
jgi:hypothetical protein